MGIIGKPNSESRIAGRKDERHSFEPIARHIERLDQQGFLGDAVVVVQHKGLQVVPVHVPPLRIVHLGVKATDVRRRTIEQPQAWRAQHAS